MTDELGKPIRQTFNVVIGWMGVAVGVVLLGSGLSAGRGATMPLLGVALGLVSWCVMVRPSLRFTEPAVVVSNVLREVTLPWEGISSARSRGSLTIIDNDGGRTTVWAIGSQKAGRGGGADDGSPRPSLRPMPGTLREAPTSSRALAEAIVAETIDNPTDAPSGRSVRPLPLNCALMAGAVVCIILGLVL